MLFCLLIVLLFLCNFAQCLTFTGQGGSIGQVSPSSVSTNQNQAPYGYWGGVAYSTETCQVSLYSGCQVSCSFTNYTKEPGQSCFLLPVNSVKDRSNGIIVDISGVHVSAFSSSTGTIQVDDSNINFAYNERTIFSYIIHTYQQFLDGQPYNFYLAYAYADSFLLGTYKLRVQTQTFYISAEFATAGQITGISLTPNPSTTPIFSASAAPSAPSTSLPSTSHPTTILPSTQAPTSTALSTSASSNSSPPTPFITSPSPAYSNSTATSSGLASSVKISLAVVGTVFFVAVIGGVMYVFSASISAVTATFFGTYAPVAIAVAAV